MDQELKQRLIGAAVITALAAIFVPMLFDDPIDETGKTINELKIPEMPAKAQDVEIMPLPEKVEDVATDAPAEKPASQPAFADEGEDEFSTAKPKLRLTAKQTEPTAPKSAQPAREVPMDVAEGEDEAPPVAPKPVVQPSISVSTQPPAPAKAVKAPSPPVAATQTESAMKSQPPVSPPPTPAGGSTRLYLNVGTFSQKANAMTLHDNLKQQGFAVSVKEVAGDKGPVFKVRVGPLLDKAKAQAVKNKLAQINVNSFVSGDE